MRLCLVLIAAGVALRQVDRAHFARKRPRTAPTADLISLQRRRVNNLTPLLLLIGQWLQIAGWWLLAAHGPLAAAVTAVAVAVHFRHLQEISHFAVHGVLARTARANLLLGEVFAHHPLALAPLPVRRRRHVHDHHPNATVVGTDPNLAELHEASLRQGATRVAFTMALIRPLTPRGIRSTMAGIVKTLRHSPSRTITILALAGGAFAIGGPAALIWGFLVPRLLLYPQLAHLSLLVEHTWFDPAVRTGPAAYVEAGRCLRLYPRNRFLAALTAMTWLPYGDLHHYAHSAHPGMRWNYLPALERHLPPPHFTPNGLLLGSPTVAGRHFSALTPAPGISGGETAPTRRAT
ncbi:dihydrouridine synthase [Streptomyces cinnamoneus]|uniref:Dihydrouridine synthase n=1 Tax=Streptomyces cinnamoneus TaxID=53446 RepID=A0A2G1X9R2_STRCJ|nr:fatty acid desaturase [Streptomyces cinnamoneus]PHQ47909.1 dihydrouridine synthase [Streptomyces cinnamoneus]PPT15534.1 dihydrouridine synthase [Streptomyces cinnamoneus]